MIYLLILLAFLADRVSKIWAAAYLMENGRTQINPYLTIAEAYNQGIAFGLFQGIGPVVGWLTVAVVVGLLVYLHRLPREQWLTRMGLAILIGGALGNQIDRLWAGEVLDFIIIPLQPGIFNVADVMIYLGLMLVILGAFIHRSPVKNGLETAKENGSRVVAPEPGRRKKTS
ncbi:MAG: signal peptidase II [Chloroflexi bacterium]|nr:signal peptidase II [Chloroflexota bacterium]